MELSKAQQLSEVLKKKPDSDGHCLQAANELLRLEAECELLDKNLQDLIDKSWHEALSANRIKANNAQLLDALNRLCAWHDGDIGPHMDSPKCAAIAREAVKKFG